MNAFTYSALGAAPFLLALIIACWLMVRRPTSIDPPSNHPKP